MSNDTTTDRGVANGDELAALVAALQDIVDGGNRIFDMPVLSRLPWRLAEQVRERLRGIVSSASLAIHDINFSFDAFSHTPAQTPTTNFPVDNSSYVTPPSSTQPEAVQPEAQSPAEPAQG